MCLTTQQTIYKNVVNNYRKTKTNEKLMTKKKVFISVGILLVISIILILNTKRVMTSYEYPEKMPEDFNFIVKLNSNEYCINTYDNTFSKSINWDKDTIINYKISNLEKNRVYQLIKEYNIIKYPNYFTPSTHVIVNPSFDYYFKSTFDSINVEIDWEFNTESKEKEAKLLKDFLYRIFDNILKEEDIKNLPETKRVSF